MMTTLINKNGNKENVEKDKGDFKLTDHYRPFLDVVAKSPFEAVEKHAKYVHKCVNTMHKMFDLYIDGKFEEARALWTQIQDAEHEADIIKNTIRDKLQKSLFMPIKREQITRILTLQDRLADAAEDVSDMLAARDTKIPEEIKPLFREHLDILERCLQDCGISFCDSRSSPTGITRRPPTRSWCSNVEGTVGPPAATMIASKGASSGQPRVPSPWRTCTLSKFR